MITPHYRARHCVRPGITGLAQIRGWRGETETEEMLLRRVESDLEYIDTWSLRRDIVILARTIVPVITARNAW
jgi:lipopolysaccharide/colanic/teichoic acid biosynthesis glycosyltransferase